MNAKSSSARCGEPAVGEVHGSSRSSRVARPTAWASAASGAQPEPARSTYPQRADRRLQAMVRRHRWGLPLCAPSFNGGPLPRQQLRGLRFPFAERSSRWNQTVDPNACCVRTPPLCFYPFAVSASPVRNRRIRSTLSAVPEPSIKGDACRVRTRLQYFYLKRWAPQRVRTCGI